MFAASLRAVAPLGRARVATVVPRVVSVAPRAAIHTSRPLLADGEEKTYARTAEELGIDKANPQFLPNNFDDWENVGYSNLAPKGHRGWEDLPAPYKYYNMKMAPEDVENEGILWKVFTDWRTAVPASAMLATPFFLTDLFVFDMRIQLAAIFWTTMAMLKVNATPAINDMFEQGIKEIKDEVYGAEAKYRAALASTTSLHESIMGLETDLASRNAEDRAIKHVEAAAATRAVRAGEVSRMREMLDAMVVASESAGDDTDKLIDAATHGAVAGKLVSDAAFQQASIADAIKAVKDNKTNLFAGAVAKEYISTMESEIAKSEAGSADDAAKAAHRREIFDKRFGFHIDSVSEDAAKAAAEDAREHAILTAKLGGAAIAPGAKFVVKSPMSY